MGGPTATREMAFAEQYSNGLAPFPACPEGIAGHPASFDILFVAPP
jgi:hypothetical protein